jgi:hypothetical protein
VSEYPDDDALNVDQPTNTIEFSTDSDDEGWWVIVDHQGNIMYREAETESGWRWQQDAAHEAAGLRSRTGESYSVRRL